MAGGINPLPLIIAVWLALTIVLLIPALVLPWLAYRIYTLTFILAVTVTWYFSKLDPIIVISIGATQAIAQLLGCWIYARKFAKSTDRPAVSPARFSAFLVVIVLATPVFFGSYKRIAYGVSLPSQISLGKLLFAPRQPNRECDIVAWELKSQELLHPPSSDWQATPYVAEGTGNINDRWLDGIGCSDAPTEIKDRILTQLNEGGSFYSKSAGVLVSPKAKFVVKFIYK